MLNDYAWVAVHSFFYFNYLCGGPSGTSPNKTELQLCLASRSGNSKRVAKLLKQVTAKASVNIRVPHLEGETIFGSTKRKLNLPLGDNTNSHHHECVNFIVPKFG